MGLKFWRIFWGLILVLFGLAFLLDNLDLAHFGWFWKVVWPLALIIIGIYLIYRNKRSGTGSNLEVIDKVFGDLKANPVQLAERDSEYILWFGDIVLDFSKSLLPEKEKKIRVFLGFGDVEIKLPKDIPVSALGKCWAGDISIFDKKEEGIFPSLQFSDENYSTSNKKLNIDAQLWFGTIKINRSS